MTKKSFYAVLLALTLFGAAGCAALVAGGAAGAGTYVWTEGNLQRDYQASLDQTYQAAMGAVQELGLQVQEREQSMSEASIEAVQNDTTYRINLDSKGENLTTVGVRVGIMGDRQASERVHSAIADRL